MMFIFYTTALNGIGKKIKSFFGGGRGWNLRKLFLTLFNNTVEEYEHF